MDKLWFNEDGDRVFGYKNMFNSKKEFVEEVKKTHLEMTGFGCIIENVKSGVFLNVKERLEAEYLYELKSVNVDIETLYHADCTSLEPFDLKDGDGTVELEDGSFINLKGEKVEKCTNCQTVVSCEVYEKNNGLCDKCSSDKGKPVIE